MTKTIQELREDYSEQRDADILADLFGESAPVFDFPLYKEKSGWDNVSFNPLHELVSLAESLVPLTKGLSTIKKKKIFDETLSGLVML